jgi:two-component system sensor histidine kinase QseC
MMAFAKRAWRAFLAPSLTRRLLAAQMLLLIALWTLAAGFVVLEQGSDQGELRIDQLYDVLLYGAGALDGAPTRQAELLRLADAAMRQIGGRPDTSDLGVYTVVRAHERVMYATPGAPRGLRGSPDGAVTRHQVGGRAWWVRSVADGATGIEVTRMQLAGSWDVFMSLNTGGYYLLPLLISLPFLAPVAWLSIRLALRPWRRAADDIAARGPHDLRPIQPLPHREAAALVDNVNALLKRVADSTERERHFIADAAHELRTPLAALRVNVEALQRQHGTAGRGALLDGIVNATARATRLVGQLLMLMRSDAQATDAPRVLAFDALVQDRLAALSVLADARRVELALELPPAPPDANSRAPALDLPGREAALVSLVDNLVDNALKYSPAHGTVTVSLRRDAEWIVFCVGDQGPGVPEPLRERVFERFYRAPDQTQQGSGLGLAICRAVAAAHGGAIVLGEAAGGGCLVTVRLPPA